ncbi:MAG: electron transport complex subunit RsxC [Oscillospiraceae bacterium]|nr:electron transport complex subunit RsxC [Oscillospiraceae bacterium]
MGIFQQRGIHVVHNKHTSKIKPVRIETCGEVTLMMKQHIGTPCEPLVKAGDEIRLGQVIGDTQAGLAAPIHASVSGKVKRIEQIRILTGEDVKAVVIASDGQMTPLDGIAPPVIKTRDDFFAAIRASGLVGLGGAGFPAHAKLKSACGDVDVLLVNAAECEPYITADHRETLDAGDDVLEGIAQIAHYLGIHKAIVGIESNKGDAIGKFRALCAAVSTPELKITTAVLPSRYPQGAEKMFIYSLTKRIVPLGKLPSSIGALVMNVASVAFLARYIKTGKPLVSRTVTVDGGAVQSPINVRTPIGIQVRELIDFCGLQDVRPKKIIMGGPMMGAATPDLNAVISKCNNAVLLFDDKQTQKRPETACIRCGNCVAGCPMKLLPLKLEAAYRANDTAALTRLDAMGCMECGSCSYVCPASHELVQCIRLGKRLLREAQSREGSKT